MKDKLIKVENAVDFWTDFEAELSVYYHIKWKSNSAIKKFFNNEIEFIKKYIAIAKKFGIAEPVSSHDGKNVILSFENYKKDKQIQGISRSNLFYCLYAWKDKMIYPTKLFVDINDDKPKQIISIDPLLDLKQLASELIDLGSIPFKVEMLKRESEIELLCYIDNDAFLFEIDNKKTKADKNIGGKNCLLDNSDLAYLNTPRLNSFLRDLKNLCFEFGATDFEFENLFDETSFSEAGVLFKNELIFFEDIFELLSENHRTIFDFK